MGALTDLLTLLEGGHASAAVMSTILVSARLFSMVRVLPFLGGRRAPATLHLGLAIVLGIALGPGRLDAVPAAPLVLVLLAKEVLVGYAVGFCASLPFLFLEQSGVIVDVTRSTQLAGSTGAGGQGAASPTGNLMRLATLAVFFVTPAHRAFWMGVEATFAAVPVTASPAWDSVATGAILASSGLFASSVMIALPVLISVLLTDLAIGAAGRFVPHSGGTFTFMPLRSVVGLGALALLLAVVSPTLARLLLESMTWLESIR